MTYDSLGTRYARTCRRLVTEHMSAHPGEWMASSQLRHLAPPGRILVNTELDDQPFGYDNAAGTVYDAGPSGERNLFALGDVLRAMVHDGTLLQSPGFPVAYRLAGWLGAAAAAERAGIREKTWTAYVSRGQAPQAGRRDPETGKAQWLAGAVDKWLAARPGSGARTDLTTAVTTAGGIAIPVTPVNFTVPGRHRLAAWRLDGAGGPLFTLSGIPAFGRLSAHASVTLEGPGLEVTGSIWSHPSDKHKPAHVTAADRKAFEAEAREELLACLRDETWEERAGT